MNQLENSITRIEWRGQLLFLTVLHIYLSSDKRNESGTLKSIPDIEFHSLTEKGI